MYCSNHDEVQFHLDRSLESLLKLVTSISTNPRIPGHEKLVLLTMVSNHHRVISETIAKKVADGIKEGLDTAVQACTEGAITF